MFKKTTKVINIHKKKGKRPHYDIYIGRKITAWGIKDFPEDSKWCNPNLTLEEYELYIRHCIDEQPEHFNLDELEGKFLGCWCKPNPCHGDILIKLLKEKKYKEKNVN